VYAVVFTYSFDHDVAVYLYKTQDEAVQHLEDYLKERFAHEATDQKTHYGISFDISEDGLYGTYKQHFLDHIETTTVRVGTVYD